MKKILILVVVVVLSIGFIGCKKKKTDDDKPKEAATLSLTENNIKLSVGDDYTINPVIANATSKEFTVTVESGADAVSVTGAKVKALAAGSAVLKVTLNEDANANATLNVTVEETKSIAFNCPASMEVGDKFTLVLTLVGLTGNAEFSSSNTSVATVSESGEIEAKAAGTTVIKASLGGKEVSATLTVSEKALPEGSLEITGDDMVFVGYTVTLKAVKKNVSGTNKYTSSDTSIATVTSAGIVKGIAPGEVTITLECGGLTATKKITVKVAPTIEITNEAEWLPINSTYQLTLKLEHVEMSELTFKSSDEKVATISDTGLITTLKEGTVRFTVSIGAVSKRMIVEVHAPSINIGNKQSTVYVDDIYNMQVTVDYANGNELSYKSSDETIATVANGIVTLLDEGKVTITITCGVSEVKLELDVRSAEPKVVYDFNGGYSEELLIASVTDQPTLAINNFNGSNGGYWSAYSYCIFMYDRSNFMNATFSDRIFIGKDSETNLYKVINIVRADSATWPDGAEYAFVISNSYETNGHGYYGYISPIVSKIEIGAYVAFDGDYKTAKQGVEVGVYFFNSIPENDSLSILMTKADKLITPVRLGFTFLGWYDKDDNKVTEITDKTRSLKIKAKWEEKNPVTAINVVSICDELLDQDTFKVDAKVVPSDAYFQQIFFESSNTDIFTVSDDGLITAINAGTATLTIHDYLNKVVYTKEITINPKPTIAIDFDVVYNGYIGIGDNLVLQPKAYGKGVEQKFSYQSSNEAVATITCDGLITAISYGTTTITITVPDTELNITVLITVKQYDDSTDLGKLIKLIVDANFGVVEYGNVSLYNDGKYRVYDSVYGSVNKYLFDTFEIHRDYEDDAVNKGTCHTTRRSTDQIEFVCVHDTATLTGTVVSIASGMANNTGNGASIHYTVGNDAIYSCVPESLIAWHAGDGTGTVFEWTNSGVSATDSKAQPIFGTAKAGDSKWYLTINGTISNIELPKADKPLTHLGPTWKVEGGKYYIGTMWWSSDYGYNSSHGGNNNSIGIEMCVNRTSDIYDTWQRTAQLVAYLLEEHDLDTTRVKQHNTFSGKNCPQCMISAGNWWDFMEMVELQYEIRTKYPTAKITMKSNNPDILDDTGRIYNPPLTTTTVSYDVTIELNGSSDTIRLYSVVNGTTTWEQWDGTYPASRIWNNGKFSLV